MSQPQKLDYAPLKHRAGNSPYAIASVSMATAVCVWVAYVVIFDDPFRSWGNEKPIRMASTAGILGILLAVRALADPSHKPWLAKVGLVFNIVAILLAWIFLPY